MSPRRPVGMTSSVGLAVIALILGIALVACGQATLPASAVPSSVAPFGSPATTSQATSAASAAPPESVGPAAIPWDEELMAILPPDLGGVAVQPDRETAADLGADPDLAGVADGLAYAIAIDPTTDEFALTSVVRFAPGVFDEDFFRDWRDTYDEGACSQAGGVIGHAEAEISGRKTYIGSCAGGVRTYHVVLPDDPIVVSVSALGERRLGEALIAGLADPP